jgi:hypothetical protein
MYGLDPDEAPNLINEVREITSKSSRPRRRKASTNFETMAQKVPPV